MVEQESSIDTLTQELEQTQQEIIDHFREVGIKLDEAMWRQLVPSFRLDDLSDQGGELEYRPEKLLALIERTGEVVVERSEFPNLNALQRRRFMLHEAAHRLDWLLSGENVSEMIELQELCHQLPPDKISKYVDHLDEKYVDSPDRAKIIRQEAMAELIAQFLESDGTFKSFVVCSDVLEYDQLATELGKFDQMDEDKQADFLDQHPDLVGHFQIFINLSSIFANDELIQTINQEGFDDWDFELLDDVQLVASHASESQPAAALPPKKGPLPTDDKASGKYDPFWLFRR